MRQSLQRSKRERYVIQLPHQMVSTIDRARQALARMETPDLAAAAAECSTASHTVTVAELERALTMAVMANATSLDVSINDDDGTLIGVVADTTAMGPWEQLERDSDAERLKAALERLEPRERQIVEAVVEDGQSFQAVATRLGLHRDSVRKAHGRVLRKLRRSLWSGKANAA